MDQSRKRAHQYLLTRMLESLDQHQPIEHLQAARDVIEQEIRKMEKTTEQILNDGKFDRDYLTAWNRDQKLRTEFRSDFEVYCHYRSAVDAGLVKILGDK